MVAAAPKRLTRPSRTISARAIITICSADGMPSRSTTRRIDRRGHIAPRKIASGASGWCRRRRCSISQAVVTAHEMAADQAAAATPSRGRPSQPRISAGVSTTATVIDSPSAQSGVTVSPTPRSSWVISRKAKNTGLKARITLA